MEDALADDYSATTGIFADADLSAVPREEMMPSSAPVPRALPPASAPMQPLPEFETGPLAIMPLPGQRPLQRVPTQGGGRLQPLSAFGDAVPQEGAHMLGVSVVLFSLGAALGVRYGGVYGGVAGGLAGGAVSNAIRAALYLRDPAADVPPDVKTAQRREALVSGTYAVVAAAGAAYLWYKLAKKPMTSNASKSEGGGGKSLIRFEDNNLGVRRAGP